MFETIDYRVEDGIATIRLNRPERRNAVNHAMHLELPLAWRTFDRDPAARVAILTGTGDHGFCTGADIADLPRPDEQEGHRAIRWTALQNRIWKPVICAVNGLTMGGGLHFVADADIVLAADHAAFCDSHVSVGLVSGLEPLSLRHRMPLEALLRLVLLGRGERLSAHRARELGLVGDVVPGDRLLPRARELAALVARNCPAALAASKKIIWQSLDRPHDAALDHAWQAIMAHNRSPDFAEGIAAFREGRPPRWLPPAPGGDDD